MGGAFQQRKGRKEPSTSDQVLRNSACGFCTWPVLLKDPVSRWSFLVSTVLGAFSGGFQVLVLTTA